MDNPIIITPVANGYVVRLPYRRPSENLFGTVEGARVMARTMADEMQKDKLLTDLQEDEASGDVEPDYMEDIKEKNVYVFLTFPEVLAFLKLKYT